MIQATAAAAASTTAPQTARSGLGALDKDAFLKLLVTQLKYQDPTQPMQDREFISQMAQFSSLEQMTNVSTGIEGLAHSQGDIQAMSLVGRSVEMRDLNGGSPVQGKVEQVRLQSGQPVLVVGGIEYGVGDLLAVKG